MGSRDNTGLPVAISTASASLHEITLVEQTLDAAFVCELLQKLIGDKVYDSDKLDKKLFDERGIELIAPHKINRVKPKTQAWKKTSQVWQKMESREAFCLASKL